MSKIVKKKKSDPPPGSVWVCVKVFFPGAASPPSRRRLWPSGPDSTENTQSNEYERKQFPFTKFGGRSNIFFGQFYTFKFIYIGRYVRPFIVQ